MERCVSLGCPEVIRLAKQDDCSGAKIPGIENGYAISCIRNWTISPLVREGESVEYTSDCGSVVIRNRQDDQLVGYEISFETALRSNELEALVTGKDLIASGGFNIGTYSNGNSLSCSVGQDDPRFILEAFYRIPKCVSGANHVRIVLPDAQFKVTEIEREGSITFYRYSAQTGIALANSFGDGPYNDFPQDVIDFLAAKGASEYTSGFDFEEEISISGACGFIEVPEATAPTELTITDFNRYNNDFIANEVLLTGTGFLGVTTVEALSLFDPFHGVLPGTSFTIIDDNNIVISYAPGLEIVTTFGFRVSNGVDTVEFDYPWALGWSADPSAAPGSRDINPTITLSSGEVRITDINGTGNFEPQFARVRVFFTGGPAQQNYDDTDIEWSSADGGNTIVITDATNLVSGYVVDHIELQAPLGFGTVSPIPMGIAIP